jgi:y4mF family transcriptional regulator
MELRTVSDLGSLVASRRRELQWSQADLAARAGISRRWVSMFENGHASAEVGRFLSVVDALGFDLRAETSAIGDEGTLVVSRSNAEDFNDVDEWLSDYYEQQP